MRIFICSLFKMFKYFAIFLCWVPQSETLLSGKLIECTFNVRFDFFEFRSKLIVFLVFFQSQDFWKFHLSKNFSKNLPFFCVRSPQSETLLSGKLIGCTFNVRFDFFEFRSKLTVFFLSPKLCN